MFNLCFRKEQVLFFFLISFPLWGVAQQSNISIPIDAFHDGIHHWNLDHATRNYPRYESSQIKEIADNLVAYQNKDGGWPKNLDWLAVLNTDSVKASLSDHYKKSTLDNRNTYSQIEYLAQAYSYTGTENYKLAAVNGINYILSLQRSNGGWRGWDVDAITFNDDVMTGVLNLLLDIVEGKSYFKWVDDVLYNRALNAFDKGVDLILRCQVVAGGMKTAWAQQHDHLTLLPVKARTFELPGITANESSSVVLLLMRIKHPSKKIIESIKCAVNWLEKSKIQGMKVEKVPLPEDQIINHEYPYDNVVVKDKSAGPLWARFYEIDTNRPFMCTRQGQKVYKLSDVNPERRTGYAWYGIWPQKVLEAYPKWLKTINE